jgi:hypothetical protein
VYAWALLLSDRLVIWNHNQWFRRTGIAANKTDDLRCPFQWMTQQMAKCGCLHLGLQETVNKSHHDRHKAQLIESKGDHKILTVIRLKQGIPNGTDIAGVTVQKVSTSSRFLLWLSKA